MNIIGSIKKKFSRRSIDPESGENRTPVTPTPVLQRTMTAGSDDVFEKQEGLLQKVNIE